MKYQILTVIVFNFLLVNSLYAYKVYPSSGHQCKSELMDTSSYSFVRENADGIWLMPWNLRSGYFSPDEFSFLVAAFKTNNMVAEINDTHVQWDSSKPNPVQLDIALKSGASIHTIMAYNEHVNGSVLTQENIDKFKALYGKNYLIVSNLRRWNDNSPEVFSQLDGISFEFQIPEKTPGIWDQVAQAVKWAHENEKYIYLLTPPGHDGYHLNNGYIEGYKAFFEFLLETAGEEVLKSEKLIFAPANYNIAKTGIKMTPELQEVQGRTEYANTVMGVARWLMEHPLYKK